MGSGRLLKRNYRVVLCSDMVRDTHSMICFGLQPIISDAWRVLCNCSCSIDWYRLIPGHSVRYETMTGFIIFVCLLLWNRPSFQITLSILSLSLRMCVRCVLMCAPVPILPVPMSGAADAEMKVFLCCDSRTVKGSPGVARNRSKHSFACLLYWQDMYISNFWRFSSFNFISS